MKTCSKCGLDLPISSFTSKQGRICNRCKQLKQLKQLRDSQQRSIERLRNRKPKKATTVRLSDLKKTVQRVFNKWIRERDANEPCISCGTKTATSWHAGHFWAMGSNGALRYNEDNCHKQCGSCNTFKSGNLLEYRIGLVKKIGEQRVAWLDQHRKEVKRWTREELNELLEKYK